MADVDPFVIPIPQEFMGSEETRRYYEYLHRFLHDLWQRTGGGDDAIQEVQIGELYETGIESALSSEIEQDLNEFDFAPIIEPDNDEDSWQPQIERAWNKRRINSNTYATDYDMYSVRDNKTVYLPENPDINSEVIVINEDGSNITVDGNGNKIKVRVTQDTSINWSNAGQSINFYWFEDGPWWVAI